MAGSRMWVRRIMRWANVLAAGVTLASALGVLGSDVFEAGYRSAHRDALWFVAAYAAFQLIVLLAFARDTKAVPWLAILKTAAAYLFIAIFARVGTTWMAWTPGRYVYHLFDAESSKAGLFAFVFLGRGAWNTANAFYFAAPWWQPLRKTRPLLGRLVTAIPLGIIAFSIWAFLELVRLEQETFSPEAHEVARRVFAELGCEPIRANQGQERSDIRQLGERRYQVRIAYNCRDVVVWVLAEDSRRGVARGPRIECCAGAG